MFFVTLLLNQLLGWMRGQPGTSSLRAIFYMDEIFGYFPPVAEPPSKRPLLTLLKQARAFGLGIVLSTQNPVDLDYKGLANAGTWFIGRLQTERDKERLLEGLSGVGGNIDLKKVSGQLSALKKRVFLMHDVHEDAPVLMNTRWALSYLAGPLTRQQIATLMKDKRERASAAPAEPARPAVASASAPPAPLSAAGPKPSPALGVSELFYPAGAPPSAAARLVYHPAAAALAQVAIFDNRLGISHIADAAHFLELGSDVLGFLWDKARPVRVKLDDLSREAPAGASFLPLPGRAAALFKSAGDDYADFLTRSYQLSLWKSPIFQAVSQPGEPERDFRVRLGQQAREKRDAELDKLRQKYSAKISSLQNQLLLAQQRLEREEEQYKGQMTQTAISMGATILGAILGRKASQIGRATTSARGASRAYYEKMDIDRARQQLDLAKSRLDDMERQLQAEADRLGAAFDPAAETLQSIILRPKKKDIAVQWSGLLWLPFWHPDTGGAEPAFPVVQS